MHLHKHNYAKGQNVQAVVNHFGVATQVITRVPGGMSDTSASAYCCQNDEAGSTLVDAGYPGSDTRIQFIKADGTPTHARERTVVERYFARLKSLWKMVSRQYCRGSKWHSLVIRAAFILTNMVIYCGGGLNK